VPCWVHFVLTVVSIPCGILGIIFGQLQLRAVRRREIPPNNESMARAGFICGLIGVILSVISIVFWVILITSLVSRYRYR